MQCCLNMRHMHATLFSKNFLSLCITFFQLTLIIKGDVWQPGLGSRSGFFFGSLEPEPEQLEKNQEPEPEPLGKKVRSWSRSRYKFSRLLSPARRYKA